MKSKNSFRRLLTLTVIAAAVVVAAVASGERPRPQIWADCELFNSTVAASTFKPGAGNFDELYAGAFKDGIGLISESKPGDQDYNGGRWHLNTLKAGVEPSKYANACSVEDLDLNDFESTESYFGCPMHPIRGGR